MFTSNLAIFLQESDSEDQYLKQEMDNSISEAWLNVSWKQQM